MDVETAVAEVRKEIGGFSDDLAGIKAANDTLNRNWAQAQEALDAFKAEMSKKGDADAVLKEKVEAASNATAENAKAVQEMTTKLNGLETALKRGALVGVNDNGQVDEAKAATAFFKTAHNRRYGADRPFDEDVVDLAIYRNYRKSFVEAALRVDEKGWTADQHKALSIGSDPDGGILAPTEMSNRIVQKVYETSPLRALATIESISTGSLEIMVDNGEAGAGWVGETQARTETTTPQFEKQEIFAHELYAEPRATQKALDDAARDLEGWLAGKVADRFGRLENTAFVSGNGVNQPRGFTTMADGTDWKQVEQIKSGSNGAFTYAGMVNLVFGLKTAYIGRSTLALNRAGLAAIMKIVDGDQRPLWNPTLTQGIQQGAPGFILGRPLILFEDLAALATNSLSAAIADWREAYTIVDRIGVRVLRDPYTAKPFIKFYTTKRAGGNVVNYEAIKLHKLAS